MEVPGSEIVLVLDTFCDAFARRDVDVVRSLFLPRQDVMVVTSEDTVLRDRAALDVFLDRYAAGETVYSWQWERSTVVIEGETAWLLAEGVETAAGPTGETRTPYRMTILCQRFEGRWLIAQAHGSSPHHHT